MATDLMTALVERSLRTLPFSRTERNGSTMAISLRSARESMALAVASRVATVSGSPRQMRVSILPPSAPSA